jgi:glycosyltransferase involved in cell wall biosynthesis
MNAFSRKQVDVLVKAAVKLYYGVGGSLHVTVTVQSGRETPGFEAIAEHENHPGIRIITDSLTSAEIDRLYEEADVYYMCSKKEGLGMGFYRPLSNSIPVMTLDTQPHNEIIKEGVNGFISSCTYEPMRDNNDSVLMDAVADVETIKTTMQRVIETHRDPKKWNALQTRLQEDVRNRLSWEAFVDRLLNTVSLSNIEAI